jgi:hypothetical protein
MPLMELAGIDLGILRAAAGVVRDEALDQGPSLKQHVVALHRSWFVRKLGPMSWPIPSSDFRTNPANSIAVRCD